MSSESLQKNLSESLPCQGGVLSSSVFSGALKCPYAAQPAKPFQEETLYLKCS